MELFAKQAKRETKIELAPLIDVIFILLIFFAVSTSLIAEKTGIKLQLPNAETTTKNKKGMVISIDQNKRLYFDKKSIQDGDLAPLIKNTLLSNKTTQFIFQADKTTPYIRVIEILDIIRLSGATDLILEAKKPR